MGHNALLCNLMTAADVSSSTKPWEQHKEISTCIYEEFFDQGDLERKHNMTPGSIYDRANSNEIPSYQVGFFDAVARPVYEGLARIDSSFDEVVVRLESNR